MGQKDPEISPYIKLFFFDDSDSSGVMFPTPEARRLAGDQPPLIGYVPRQWLGQRSYSSRQIYCNSSEKIKPCVL